MAEIQMKHMYKKFEDGVVAVKDFNLDIKEKEFVIFGWFLQQQIKNNRIVITTNHITANSRHISSFLLFVFRYIARLT